jgi:hypothetical protein
MALAVVGGGERPRKRLQALKTQDEAPEAESLAERIAAAGAAVTEPRRRVSELEADLAAAVERSDYAAAAKAQERLPAAREELALAEVDLRVLSEAQARLDAAAAAEQRVIQEAQARDEARRVVEDAMASEKRALDGIEEALAQMRAAIGAAKDAFRQAQAWEAKAYQERARAHQAHVTLGERPNGMRITAPNRASVLLEQDKTVRALMQWGG